MSEFHITDFNARNMAFSHIARFHFYNGNANLWKHYAWLSGHIGLDPHGIDAFRSTPFELRWQNLYSDGWDQ